MAENLFDKASYSLVRTNPKLTGNVKIVSDGTDIYLESFSANTRLSSQKFKAFKVNGSDTYDQDVFRFFDFGKFPLESAYEIFQEYEDTAVLSNYRNQYEMFYCAGTRSIASESYTQSLGTLAPLWLNEQMPNYFVIFRLDNPAAVNNFRAETENANTQDAQTSAEFSKNVLENCTAIKTFDLTEGTALGSYIRNYRNQETFPEVPLNITWRKDEPILWNGISYKSGGFTSAGNFAYKDMVVKDSTIIQDEYLFTQGFQNNGILLANLLNLEFLFDDPTADDYSINRYFGMYVNDIEEGQFDISGEAFFKGTSAEKTQQPTITTVDEVSQYLNTPFKLTNENGILLYLDPLKTETITGVPTPARVSEVESIFYVKDKEDDFHTIKKGSTWDTDQIRLFDTEVDISLFTGYKEPDTFANASIINRAGVAQMYIKVLDNVQEGSKISFYDGAGFTGSIFADSTMAPVVGKSFERFYNPNGTLQEVAQSITSAINKGINENDRFFVASYNDTTVYVKSRFSGTRFNRIGFEMDTQFPEQFNQLETYPITSLADPSKKFVGGNNTKNSLLKVTLGDQDRFEKGNFVQTTGGYATIGDWVPYTDEPIYDGFDRIIGYTDINKYAIITCNDNQIMVTRSNQVALYSDYKPSFGRFSFFEVKDFDFDFYSTLYSEEGELAFEEAEYNQLASNAVPPFTIDDYVGVSKNPQIRNFYDNGGFYNLIGLLNDAEDQNPNDEYVKSEYIRLEENFLTSQAAISRIAPYINKWAWVNDGKDVRNHPYRLDVNEAFGLNNFAPSKWDKSQEASGYTHEWYYLSQFPEYFTDNAIKNSWSYSVNSPVDNTPANIVTGQPLVLGTFQDVTKNYFDDYFVVQKFDFGGGQIVEIDRQLRYGRFDGGNEKNFSQTFLRGVRVIAKPKAKGNEKPNFDARSLAYVQNGEFNDYRFSVMMVPNLPNKPEFEIKFIKNEKWKTVVMLISINYAVECLNDKSKSIIDRTSLYSLNSAFLNLSTCAPNFNQATGEYVYLDTTLSGAISLNQTTQDSNGVFIVKGQSDVNGVPSDFVNDIRILEDGTYGKIKFTIPSPAGNQYQISGIVDVIDSNTFRASSFTVNGFQLNVPSSTPGNGDMKSATYTISDGGYLQFQNRLNSASFGEIFDAVNQGNPSIIYETIKADGSQVTNTDGTLAQTFMIELRAQSDILKSIYVGVLPDPAKPTAFNLTDVVGYDLSLQKTPRITPIARHAGYYSPYALPLLSFRDPYQNIDFDVTGGIDDEDYKLKVMELCKYKNSQFNSNDPKFGQIQNFFYHKVNEEDPSTVLELSRESAFPSLYPLINEIGIDYKDFYAFSSNWEPSYFTKSIDKSQTEKIIGTRSMFERKSFFGSKYLKVPETIILDTFEPSPFVKAAIRQPDLIDATFMYQDQASVTVNQRIIQSEGVTARRAIRKKPSAPVISFYLFNQKRLMEYLFTPIKNQFLKYVNEAYGFGDLETLDDDVNQYIKENILKLYKVERVDFYTLASRTKEPSTFTTAELTDAEKINNGLTINSNVSSKTLNTNLFDLKLIYNKRTGFSESFGFSVTIVKK